MRRQWLPGFALVLLALIFLTAGQVAAQDKKDKKGEQALRTVHGSVVDNNDNAVPTSVVYLLNVKTQDVKTYIADDAGNFRFSGLDPNVDYEIHAEHGDLTSSTRTVSSFDSRRDIALNLKLSRPKATR